MSDIASADFLVIYLGFLGAEYVESTRIFLFWFCYRHGRVELRFGSSLITVTKIIAPVLDMYQPFYE